MSCHEQLPHQQHVTRSISDEIIKAVDSIVSDKARPAAITRACLKVERIPRKLRKKQGQRSMKPKVSESDGQRHPQESASAFLLTTKHSLGKKLVSQSLGVSSAVKNALARPLLRRERLTAHSGIPVNSDSDLVARHRFSALSRACAGIPDPLRANPPFAQPKFSKGTSWRRRNQGSGLDTCQEEAEEDAINSLIRPGVAEGSGNDRPQPGGTGENKKEISPVPCALLADTNQRLREENRQLNSALHELISERIVLAGEVANLRQVSKVTEGTLMALWTLSKPHFSGSDDVTSAAEVPGAIERLRREEAKEKPSDNRGPASEADGQHKQQQQLIADLEAELVQQAKFVEHCRKAETVARGNMHKLSMENKDMQARLRQAEESRQQLQAMLEATEQRFRCLEAHILQNMRISSTLP